ncbi:hypothetical protein Tco_1446869 [Tanacetum coccineum]
MELITPDLICPSAYQLLRNSSGDSGPELSFDKSASPERLFSLARVSLVEASKPILSFGCSGEDYTSSVEKLDKKKGDVKLLCSEVTCLDSKLENLQRGYDALGQENRELRCQRDAASEETDAKLSKQALTVRGLQNSLVLEKSKSKRYKDAMDGLREEITQFVGSSMESLVRKLLLSDEFHAALARVASFGINYGVKRGLRMGRTDVEFEAAVQQVSNFRAGVKADFDKALVDFPTTPFPFLSKIAATFGGTLFDVAQILPDKFIRSATSVFVAPFIVNEALEQMTELITPDLICPSTYQLLRNSSGDSGPDLSFDKSASPERLFGLARASLVATLCKQGDWFSFAKRRASSSRHSDAAIDDLRPAAGSFNMADVCRLSAHVIKLRDMPEGVLVLSGLSRVLKNRLCDLVLRVADGNVMGIHDFLSHPEWTGAEVQEEPYLDVRPTLQRLPFYCTPLLRPMLSALAQSSGSTTRPCDESDGDDDACVEILLVTPLRSAAMIPPLWNQGRSSAAPTGIMVDDAAAPSGGASRQRPSSGPAPSFRDVSGDAIHTDFFPFSAGPYYATYPEDGVAGNCEFTREEWDAPYRPTFEVLTKEVFKDPAVCKTIVDQFPTPGEMVGVKGLSDDQLTTKMSVLHCMMMSHGGELLARYRGLNQSHHEYVLSTDSRLKGYEEKVVGLTGLELQVSTLKKQVSGLNDKLATSDASFAKSKAKGKERKKKIKSLSKSLDNLHSEVARLSAALNQANIIEAERDEEILRLNATPPEFSSFFRGQFQGLVWKFLASNEFSRVQSELLSLAASAGFERGLSMHWTKDEFADISEYVAEPLSVILHLEPEKLIRPANVPIPRDTRVSSPIAKESTVTLVNAVVDGSDFEMADGAAPSKPGGVFVQGVSHVLDDVIEVTAVESERISSVPTYVVVALSIGGKGDGSVPSSTIEEVVVPPFEGRGACYAREHLLLRAWGKLTIDVLLSIQRIPSHATRPKPNGFPLGTCSIAGQASIVLLDICYDYKSIQLLPLASWLQFGFAPSALLVALPFLLLLVSSIDGLVLIPTDTSWLRNSSFIVASPINTFAFRFKIFRRCVI